MRKNTKIGVAAGVVLLLAVASTATYNSVQRRSGGDQTPAEQSQSVEFLHQEMARIAQYEFENGCVEKNAQGRDVFCGESKIKVEAAEAKYQAALKASLTPDAATQQADITGIRNFMGDQGMALKYTRSAPPANFSVGVVTPLSDSGDRKSETPAEWKRTVNVYTATKEIEGTCEVYEFEVYPKTHEVVEVRVIYPVGYQGRCDKGSLFSTSVSESEIKANAQAYLARIKGEADDEYKITQLSRGNTSRWEWKWEDADYRLPAGVSGSAAVDSKPTVRLHIASSGKLVQYNNTIPLFD